MSQVRRILAYKKVFLLVAVFLVVYGLSRVLTTQAQTDVPWATAGANAQRTSWTPNEAPAALKALWVKRIVPYISQKVQPVGAENKIFVSTARGVYAFDADN
jgi:hypothetical protein